MGRGPEGKYVNPHEFRGLGLPLGDAIVSAGRMSKDTATQAGLGCAGEILNTRGIVILDYHRSIVDMLVVAGQISEVLETTSLVGPIAAKHLQSRLKNHLIGRINLVDGMNIIEVVRGEDRSLGLGDGLTPDEIENRLGEYNSALLDTVNTPGGVVVIAPFGTRRKNFKVKPNIRTGVADLLRTGVPAFCSYADLAPRAHPYRVFLSGAPLVFPDTPSREEMTDRINAGFAQLLELAQ